jgi:hypothetical protein
MGTVLRDILRVSQKERGSLDVESGCCPRGGLSEMKNLISKYETSRFFDEMFEDKHSPRPHYRQFCGRLSGLSLGAFDRQRRQANQVFLNRSLY